MVKDYTHLGDHIQTTYEMTSGFKPFTGRGGASNVLIKC